MDWVYTEDTKASGLSMFGDIRYFLRSSFYGPVYMVGPPFSYNDRLRPPDIFLVVVCNVMCLNQNRRDGQCEQDGTPKLFATHGPGHEHG